MWFFDGFTPHRAPTDRKKNGRGASPVSHNPEDRRELEGMIEAAEAKLRMLGEDRP
jgi:hypothetical protein